MGVVTFTLDPEPTQTTDHHRIITGQLSLSASYANGTGDTFQPIVAFGLDILTDLFMFGTLAVYKLSDTVPLRGTATAHIKAFGTGSGSGAVFAEITNAVNLSADVVRFQAHGF